MFSASWLLAQLVISRCLPVRSTQCTAFSSNDVQQQHWTHYPLLGNRQTDKRRELAVRVKGLNCCQNCSSRSRNADSCAVSRVEMIDDLSTGRRRRLEHGGGCCHCHYDIELLPKLVREGEREEKGREQTTEVSTFD